MKAARLPFKSAIATGGVFALY